MRHGRITRRRSADAARLRPGPAVQQL